MNLCVAMLFDWPILAEQFGAFVLAANSDYAATLFHRLLKTKPSLESVGKFSDGDFV
jgi:hypothetical protein